MTTGIPIGYFPKRRTPPSDWLKAPAVREVCSVSECIAKGPDGWIEAWLHNEWGVFDTPDAAWSVVPDGLRNDFVLFAYDLYPVVFVRGSERRLEIQARGVSPRRSSSTFLGFDIVSRGVSDFFECSPLSCNGWAAEVGANRWCLLDELAEALHLASIAEASGCEPGDYYVVGVWRSGSDV